MAHNSLGPKVMQGGVLGSTTTLLWPVAHVTQHGPGFFAHYYCLKAVRPSDLFLGNCLYSKKSSQGIRKSCLFLDLSSFRTEKFVISFH